MARYKKEPVKHSGAPVSLEAETAALGAAVRDPELAEILTSELQPTDFYKGEHHGVFQALCGLLGDNQSPHAASVADRAGMARSDVDGLVEAGMGVCGSHMRTLVRDLRNTGALRVVYNAAMNASTGLSRSSKLDEVLQALETDLYRVDRAGSHDAEDGDDVLQKTIDEFLERKAKGGGAEISTGLADLDRAILGLRPGKMVVVAARPSMGKTALSGTIRRAVVNQGFGVAEFSLEMSAGELMERELAYLAQINSRKIMTGKGVSDEEVQRVMDAGKNSTMRGRWAIDDKTYSVSGIKRRARLIKQRMERKGIKLSLVIVDYLGLLSSDGDEERHTTISAASRAFKLLSKELNCCVMALSQLNRNCEARDDRRPMLSDLRESGSVEQDADAALFLYREHLYDTSFPPEEAELLVRKNRSGPLGTVHLKYSPKTCTFSDREISKQIQVHQNVQPN